MSDVWLDAVREAHKLSLMRNHDVVITKRVRVELADQYNRKYALEIFRAPRPWENEVAA